MKKIKSELILMDQMGLKPLVEAAWFQDLQMKLKLSINQLGLLFVICYVTLYMVVG